MKKRFLAFLLSLTTAFSAVALGGCEFSLNFGSGSYEDGDTNTDIDTDTDTDIDTDTDTDGDGSGDNDGCAEHTDANNDGTCDECKNSVIRNIDIFAVNDLHGKVLDGDNHIGVDEMTTYLRQAKAQNPNTIFLSSGDMWQGANLSNLTKGKLVNDWMNDVGFVSMTLGNHEYDWGEECIEANAQEANFPYLAINIYDNATGKRVEYCDASVMYETNGARIGIIGAMGDCYSSISADKVQGVHFKTGSELTALVKEESEKLRAQGADLIVYSLHDDYRESGKYDTALSNGYVDIVFEGHSHQTYVEKDGKGVYHLQGGGDNKGVSRAQITLNIANETHSVTSAKTVNASAYSSYAKDPIVARLTTKYEAMLEEVNRVVGYTDSYRSSNAICDKVAELYLALGEKTWGSQYNIVLGGAYLKTRSPYDLEKGNVTYGDLVNILPFDNQIVLCSLSGSKLLEQFINTSNSSYHISLGDYYNSTSISLNKTYYIVTDTYTSLYAYNGCTEIARYDETTFARDLLADYLGTGAWGVDPNATPTPNPDEGENGGNSGDSGNNGGNSGDSGNNSGNNGGNNSGNTGNEIQYTSIADILQIGAGLAHNQATEEYYYVKGTITEIANTTYGNIYITDEAGNVLYTYGLYDENGTRYDSMSVKPVVGDEVVLKGVIKRYNNTIELFSPTLLEIIK